MPTVDRTSVDRHLASELRSFCELLDDEILCLGLEKDMADGPREAHPGTGRPWYKSGRVCKCAGVQYGDGILAS